MRKIENVGTKCGARTRGKDTDSVRLTILTDMIRVRTWDKGIGEEDLKVSGHGAWGRVKGKEQSTSRAGT